MTSMLMVSVKKELRYCELCKNVCDKPKSQGWPVYLKKRFCSHQCANKVIVKKGRKPSALNILAVKFANSGSKSHFWKGGITSNRREYRTMKSMERYALQKGAEGSFTIQQWLDLKEKYNNSCVRCGVHESVRKMTKDHIIPLTKGGSNYINNIQPLCQSCNSRKHNTIQLTI